MRVDPLLINYPIRIREVILGILILLNILFLYIKLTLKNLLKPLTRSLGARPLGLA